MNWLYPLGFFGFGFAEAIFTQWIVFFHNPPSGPVGLGAWTGTVLLVCFLIQGLLNPVLGYFSDHIRHRWGRRRPLILLCSLPMALCFWAMWQTLNPYLSLMLICGFGFFFVCVVQPHITLLPGITHHEKQRVNYSLAGGVFSLLASALGLVGGAWILKIGSFELLGMLGAAGIVLTLFIPMLFIRENPVNDPPASRSIRDFLQENKSVLSNTAFFWYLRGNAFLIGVIMSLVITLPYLCTQVLHQERSFVSVLNGFVLLGAVIGGILIQSKSSSMVVLKLLKYSAMVNGCLLLFMAVLSFFVTLPLALWLGFMVSMGVLVIFSVISPQLIISEMTTADRKNREGTFFGLNGMVINFANALGSQLSAFILSLSILGSASVLIVMLLCSLLLCLAVWSLKKTEAQVTF